ncbi:hypothetical protein AAF712_008567 [Marasmius tenuissimus]|uniref:Uncharacterized protein n=1 Tax=Marasmius tenuissimus TaxID=585030 RepID=A0ABR2ZUK1_9AGAR
MAPASTNSKHKKLSWLLYALHKASRVLTPVKISGAGGATTLEYSPIHEALIRAKVPTWIETERPDYVDPKWDETWKEIRERIQATLLKLEGRGAIEEFHYREAGLDEVLDASRKESWAAVGDKLILEVLAEHHVSIREVYTDPDYYVEIKDDDEDKKGKKRKRSTKPSQSEDVTSALARGFCSLKHWEGLVTTLLPKILGPHCFGSNGIIVRPEWITWWKVVLQTLLDAASKQHTRYLNNLETAERNVAEVVGKDIFMTTDLPDGFTLAKARQAIKYVRYWATALRWLPRSHEDVESNATRIDPDATENRQELIEKRWAGLSRRAKKIEYAQMLVGWLSRIVEKRTGVALDFAEAAEPEEETIIEYGKAMAEKISAKSIDNMPKPTPEETDDVNVIDNAISMYLNSDIAAALKQFLGEGADIGVGQFATWSPADLWSYIGLLDGLPVGFRHWTCDDPARLPEEDVEFEGSDKVHISWHQLVFIAALFGHMSDTKLAPVEGILHTQPADDASISLREQWGAIPGVALFDDVGLGKIMCGIAGIASLQTLFGFQHATGGSSTPSDASKANDDPTSPGPAG